MNRYSTSTKPDFPDPRTAPSSGELLIGGELNTEWLLEAYRNGIFPWPWNENILIWYSPDPRAVMKPSDVHMPHSMRPVFNQKRFQLRIDTAFDAVIELCAAVHTYIDGDTWITTGMLDAYKQLHHEGYAHSFEAWQNGKLAGGLYGVSLGRMFFGESMFTLVPDASKFAFISMARLLDRTGFTLIDCQQETTHTRRLGCTTLMPRKQFLRLVRENNSLPTLRGKWQEKDGKIVVRT